MKCQQCQKEFKETNVMKYCRSCRKKWALAHPRPNRPANQRPPKNNNRKPPVKKPQQQQQSTEQAIVKAMRALATQPSGSRMQSALSNVAKKRYNGASGVNAVRAANRLLLSTLNPKATAGQRALKVNIDQTMLPKKSFEYDSQFTIRSVDDETEYKMMLLPSPIIIATIVSNKQLQIGGTNVISLVDSRAPKFNYTYHVLGNKTGFLGDVSPDFIFTPREDWSKFRGVCLSGSMEWVGPQIVVNGVIYVARITNKDDLAEFNPLSKADSVSTTCDNMITVSGQHVNPTLEWQYVDENDDTDDNKDQDSQITEVINFLFADSTLGALSYGTLAPTTLDAAGLNGAISGALLDAPQRAALNRIGGDIFAKYSSAFVHSVGGAGQVVFSCKPRVELCIDNAVALSANIAEWENISINDSPVNFDVGVDFASLCLANIASVISTSAAAFPNAPPTGPYGVNMSIRLVLKASVNDVSAMNTSAKISSSLISDLITGRDQLDHFSDNFLCPAINLQSDKPFHQVHHSINWELTVEDDSPFTMDTVSTSQADPTESVSAAEFKKYCQIMEGMPPAIIYNDTGMSQQAQTQLASRGIIKDIANFLGPLAQTIFPGFAPVIGIAQGIANQVDSAFL